LQIEVLPVPISRHSRLLVNCEVTIADMQAESDSISTTDLLPYTINSEGAVLDFIGVSSSSHATIVLQ